MGELSWTLFYPDVLTEPEAAAFPRVAEAARLLAAGQAAEAEAVLAGTPAVGTEAGLRDALLAIIAVGRKDAAAAMRLAERAVAAAPGSAVPRLALSYARQLATDLDGAFAAAEEAARLAPREPLPQARLAEIHLMRGETRAGAPGRERGGGAGRRAAGAAGAGLRGAGGAARGARRGGVPAGAAGGELEPAGALGLGLAQIKQGDLDAGTVQIENAVAHDPSSSLLRSYLGKAYFEELRDAPRASSSRSPRALDPSGPDAVVLRRDPQADRQPTGGGVARSGALDRAQRQSGPFRSRLLLDQDAATRGVALGRIYEDLGFEQLGRTRLQAR